jgi:hypothetical protein
MPRISMDRGATRPVIAPIFCKLCPAISTLANSTRAFRRYFRALFSMRFGGIARKMAATFVTATASMTACRATIITQLHSICDKTTLNVAENERLFKVL